MSLPSILFNNTSGSDTEASGAGPASAVSGSAAAHTNGSPSTTIILTNSPDLSGVATDGSHVLWLKTSSTTRRFSKITGKDDGADTVTVEDSFTIASGSAVDYAIGGKRKTIEHADSVRLFIADAKGGWTITLEDDQPAITASIACSASGDLTGGQITLQGDSATSRRTLTSATDNVSPLSGGLAGWTLKNLIFTSTAATKTSSYGFVLNATSVISAPLLLKNCIFGDATNTLQRGWFRSATANTTIVAINCEMKNCISFGCGTGGGVNGGGLELDTCFIHDNGGGGVDFYYSYSGARHVVRNCIISDNTGVGLSFNNDSANNVGRARIEGNTIHNNSSDGIALPNARQVLGLVLYNNQITKNGGYGVNCGGSAALNDALVCLVDHNNTGTGSLANTSGAYNNLTAGANDLQVDPSYTNAAGDDYSIGTACKGAGFPDAADHIGINSATHSSVDIGAAQRPEATPDFPDVGNVTEDDTVDGVQGTYHEATEAEVQQGVTFGASSALTGTYVGGGGRPEIRGSNL